MGVGIKYNFPGHFYGLPFGMFIYQKYMDQMVHELSAIISIGLENKIIEEFNLKKDHYFDDPSITLSAFSGGVSSLLLKPHIFSLSKTLRSPTKFFLNLLILSVATFLSFITKFSDSWEKVLYSEEIEITASAKKSRIIHSKNRRDNQAGDKKMVESKPNKEKAFA